MSVIIFTLLSLSEEIIQHLLTAKIMPRPKDDPAAERLLDNFYKYSAKVLFGPILLEVPGFKDLRGAY